MPIPKLKDLEQKENANFFYGNLDKKEEYKLDITWKNCVVVRQVMTFTLPSKAEVEDPATLSIMPYTVGKYAELIKNKILEPYKITELHNPKN